MELFPTYEVQLGAASFGRRRGTEGVVFHTTESVGQDMAAARATARWQETNPGSYNFIIAVDGTLLSVPYLEAAGGLNPASRSWAPGRFPWLRQLLSPAAYADPNAYLVNVAFAGRAADFERAGWPVSMVDQAARLVRWVEAAEWGADNAILSRHADWQSNRSDPGTRLIAAVLARYAELGPAPAPAPPAEPDLAGTLSAFGTRYPSYVHTAADALAWVNRNIRRLRDAGTI